MESRRVNRRTFLRGAAAASVGLGAFPAVLRAQPRTIKVGMVEPVSGPMADVGQDSRLGAQIAVDAINQAGGITSLGGAKIELMTADSQTKVEVARAEAERLINAGAHDVPARRASQRPGPGRSGRPRATRPAMSGRGRPGASRRCG